MLSLPRTVVQAERRGAEQERKRETRTHKCMAVRTATGPPAPPGQPTHWSSFLRPLRTTQRERGSKCLSQGICIRSHWPFPVLPLESQSSSWIIKITRRQPRHTSAPSPLAGEVGRARWQSTIMLAPPLTGHLALKMEAPCWPAPGSDVAAARLDGQLQTWPLCARKRVAAT